MELSAAEPARVGVAGDWHGNTRWAEHAIGEMAGRLAGEPVKIILHAGDFGIWPGGYSYLAGVCAALREHGVTLAFVEGNHDFHDALENLGGVYDGKGGQVKVGPGLYHLRRGHRWNWHGRTWLALGGAASVDRASRIPGRSWWPQETITTAQAEAVTAAGRADVMLTHDAPAGIPIDYPFPSSFWAPEDIHASQGHRELLRSITGGVGPAYLIHGHHHVGSPRWKPAPGLAYMYASLNTDGDDRNWGILNARTMEWEIK